MVEATHCLQPRRKVSALCDIIKADSGNRTFEHTLIEKWSRLGIKAGLLSILGSTLTENTGEMNYEQCGAINTPNLVAVKQDLDLYKTFFLFGLRLACAFLSKLNITSLSLT